MSMLQRCRSRLSWPKVLSTRGRPDRRGRCPAPSTRTRTSAAEQSLAPRQGRRRCRPITVMAYEVMTYKVMNDIAMAYEAIAYIRLSPMRLVPIRLWVMSFCHKCLWHTWLRPIRLCLYCYGPASSATMQTWNSFLLSDDRAYQHIVMAYLVMAYL